MSQPEEQLHMAIDTGGTFTDVAVRATDGTMHVWKLPSTPAAPDEAVIAGVHGALERISQTPQHLTRFVHGSTVATNTVITRDGARVGMVTTKGFRDVLAIAHQARPAIYDQHQRRPEPLIPREAIVEATQRMDAEGNILVELDETALQASVEDLRDQHLDVIVVSFLNAYVNAAHEQRAAELIAETGVTPHVVAATDVTSEMREYERTSTAAINAYVAPRISSYIQRLEHGLDEAGVQTGWRIMQSSGGLLSPEDAAHHPARTVLSGLAGWCTPTGAGIGSIRKAQSPPNFTPEATLRQQTRAPLDGLSESSLCGYGEFVVLSVAVVRVLPDRKRSRA